MSPNNLAIGANTRRMALLGVAAATVAATVATTTVPTPPALLAESHHSVSLTGAVSPYQQLQNVVDTVLPALVNTFGGKPKVTLQSLLSQIPSSLLTDVLNANGGAINVNSLLTSIGFGNTGSSLNSAITGALASALGGLLTTATTGTGATTLISELSSAIASAVGSTLNGLSITVPVPGLGNQTIGLSSILDSTGINNLVTSVANLVAGGLVTDLTGLLPNTSQLASDLLPALPNVLDTILTSANLTDASGNIKLGNLLNLLGVNLSGIQTANALTVTSAGPLFTAARLFAGVDLGWVPGTETAVANSVNSTGYLDVGTSTLKTNLADALSGVLGDGSLASSLGTDLTPALTSIISQIVGSSTANLQSDLTSALNSALAGLNLSIIGLTIPVGTLLQSAVDPLIGGLVSGLTSGLQGTVSSAVSGVISGTTGSISGALNTAVTAAINAIPNLSVADLRVPIVIGSGLGAFSAGAAYKDVLAELSAQPGGANFAGTNPVAGSLTILPELLLNNAGRANGGLLARFSSILKLFGINAVTPDVATSSSGGTAIGSTGLALGGANLLPVKVDATVEYQLMSDFAAWPDPFTLVNNLASLIPTYMLRGLDTSAAIGQVTTALQSLVSGLTGQQSVNPNIYLTVAAKTLPLLEPMYLVGDVMNLVGLRPVATFVNDLANAMSPALTSLVNLGYSDAYWDPTTGTYQRTLQSAAQQVQFGTLPHINWSQVLPNVLNSLVKGFQTAFTANAPVPNAIKAVLSGLSGGVNGLLSGLLGGLTSLGAATPVAAA
ncbi:MAG: hypothetical protein WCE30_18060, partial [Mycobacterium sp.]